jgi:single-strand DNA-binding protein
MTTLAPVEPDRSQFQVINLTGRLTADPELRAARNDTIVGGLRLAIQRPRKDGEDQGADYVDVTVFGRQAETCAKYLAKGRRVGVSGRLHHSEWDGENGRRQKLEVIADNVEFLDPRKADDQPQEEAEPATAA